MDPKITLEAYQRALAASASKSPSKTRHEVSAWFLSWDQSATGTIIARASVIGLQASKRIGDVGSFTLTLLPHTFDDGRSYDDVLGPCDWCFILIDPCDESQANPECFMVGMIDSVRSHEVVSENGQRMTTVVVTGSGWEKALEKTQGFSDPELNDAAGITGMWNLVTRNIAHALAPGEDGNPYVAQKVTVLIPDVIRAWFTAVNYVPNTRNPPGDGVQRRDVGPDMTSRMFDVIDLRSEGALVPRGDSWADDIDSIDSADPGLLEPDFDSSVGAPAPPQAPLDPRQDGTLVGVKVPQLNKPLYDILQIIMQDLQDHIFLETHAWVGLIGDSVLKILSALSNRPLNELIYDVRDIRNPLAGVPPNKGEIQSDGGMGTHSSVTPELVDNLSQLAESPDIGMESSSVRMADVSVVANAAPTLILRRRPLFKAELLTLPKVHVSQGDTTEVDLGRSDAEAVNIVNLESMLIGPSTMIKISGRLNEYINAASFARYGVRYFYESVPGLPNEQALAVSDWASLQVWVDRLYQAYLINPLLYSGTISVRRFIRNAVLGCAMVYERLYAPVPMAPTATKMVPRNGRSKILYIEGVSVSWSYGSPLIHSFELTRGYPL